MSIEEMASSIPQVLNPRDRLYFFRKLRLQIYASFVTIFPIAAVKLLNLERKKAQYHSIIVFSPSYPQSMHLIFLIRLLRSTILSKFLLTPRHVVCWRENNELMSARKIVSDVVFFLSFLARQIALCIYSFRVLIFDTYRLQKRA